MKELGRRSPEEANGCRTENQERQNDFGKKAVNHQSGGFVRSVFLVVIDHTLKEMSSCHKVWYPSKHQLTSNLAFA